MNCEHFLFNGMAKYDVRVLAPVSDQLLPLRTSQNTQSVPDNMSVYRILMSCNNILYLLPRSVTDATLASE